MTIDLWLRDVSGRPLALVAHNRDDGPPQPAQVCVHGRLCEACR